ncbi:phosphotransferase [Mycoplasmatota bacterium]|nr:phosphotransferase [Mycoplasmatota bacterium]
MIEYEKVIGVRTDKTIYKHDQLVIKKFNSHYKKSQVINEALNLSRVEETSLNIPKLKSVHERGDSWLIELEFIKGKSLHRLMEENEHQFSNYLNDFVNLQIKVHETKAPILMNMNDKLSLKIEQSNLKATERIALRQALNKQPRNLSLCHGDFFPANIIISNDKKAYIIDWAHASIGSKYADVCNTYLDLWIEFSYKVAEDYLSLYLDKTESLEEDVKSWLPIVAAARSNKGIKEEKAFLLSLVKEGMGNI